MKIKTINNEFKVIQKKDFGLSGSIGFCKYTELKIEIKDDICLKVKKETLLHEYCHAMLIETGLSDVFSSDQNESICNFFATAFIHFRKHNIKELDGLK